MPGKGKAILREENNVERAARPLFAGEPHALRQNENAAGETPTVHNTYNIYLNNFAYWRNVPERVWEYTIGGYQVMKKWLSYREYELLGRALTIDEAREVTNMARRIAAILLLHDELDQNYRQVKENIYDWKK